jgi:hypothetical protein
MKNRILFLTLILGLFSCVQEKDQQQGAIAEKVRTYAQTTDIPEGILTPDVVETSIGTLNFRDGVPELETAELVYENLDRMRGVDVFLKCMPAASIRHLMLGPEAIGTNDLNRILIFEELMDSKPLYLTGNTSTLYTFPHLYLKDTGPIVLEVPPGMLGAFNDAWFRYVQDIGPFGQDKGQGGKYLVIPPGYDGEIPEGYFIVHSPSYRIFPFMRSSIASGLEAAVANIKDNLKIYPLDQKDNPPAMEYVNGSGKSFNTIHDNDIRFYYTINEVIQEEPLELIDPETRGLLASIGIEKGKAFEPDDRMMRILTDAVAIANATARSIVWYPRVDGFIDNMKGTQIYPGDNSAWHMAWVDKNVFFTGKDGHTINSDARVMFFYPYTAVTPAMAVTIPGKGSDGAMAYVDANKLPFDGAKLYKIHIPPDPPAKDFWALTIYDSQTRSQLQTDQKFPSVGSQTEGLKKNDDGSFDIYFGPEASAGFENNWLQTIPGKSWFVILRMYGPLQPWIDKTWRPGEIELVK